MVDIGEAFLLCLEYAIPGWGLVAFFRDWGLIESNIPVFFFPMLMTLSLLLIGGIITLFILDITWSKVLAVIYWAQGAVIGVCWFIIVVGNIAGILGGIFILLGLGLVLEKTLRKKCDCIGQPDCECAV